MRIEPLWMAYHSVDLTSEPLPCWQVNLFLFVKDEILIFEHKKRPFVYSFNISSVFVVTGVILLKMV